MIAHMPKWGREGNINQLPKAEAHIKKDIKVLIQRCVISTAHRYDVLKYPAVWTEGNC